MLVWQNISSDNVPIQNNFDMEVDFGYEPENEVCDDNFSEKEDTDIDDPPGSIKLAFNAYVKYLICF